MGATFNSSNKQLQSNHEICNRSSGVGGRFSDRRLPPSHLLPRIPSRWKWSGIRNGNAGPFGASATGVGISNAYNGGFSSGSGSGFGSTSPFGYNAGGTGNSFSFGRNTDAI